MLFAHLSFRRTTAVMIIKQLDAAGNVTGLDSDNQASKERVCYSKRSRFIVRLLR